MEALNIIDFPDKEKTSRTNHVMALCCLSERFFNENFVQVSLAPSVEWLDAYSEIYTDAAEADIGVVSDDDDVDGDATLKAMGNCGQVLNNNKG